jgi:hypothetical protein
MELFVVLGISPAFEKVKIVFELETGVSWNHFNMSDLRGFVENCEYLGSL